MICGFHSHATHTHTQAAAKRAFLRLPPPSDYPVSLPPPAVVRSAEPHRIRCAQPEKNPVQRVAAQVHTCAHPPAQLLCSYIVSYSCLRTARSCVAAGAGALFAIVPSLSCTGGRDARLVAPAAVAHACLPSHCSPCSPIHGTGQGKAHKAGMSHGVCVGCANVCVKRAPMLRRKAGSDCGAAGAGATAHPGCCRPAAAARSAASGRGRCCSAGNWDPCGAWHRRSPAAQRRAHRRGAKMMLMLPCMGLRHARAAATYCFPLVDTATRAVPDDSPLGKDFFLLAGV